jgi:hypothetical protein
MLRVNINSKEVINDKKNNSIYTAADVISG